VTGRMVRLGVAASVGVAIGVLGLAGAAAAHVTVNPDQAPAGGQARLAFRVPDESDTASTTKLEVALPADQPFASVLVMPLPGWTASTATTKLATPITTDDGDEVTEAVTQIVWTANSPDTAIKPGQFQEFPVSLGPLPKTGSVTFKAVQTYSDGTVVRWIDQTVAGQPEPDHPAPVLKLAAASTDDSAATAGGGRSMAAKTDTTNSGTATAALTVAIIGAVLGLVGAVIGALAMARARRAT
jgi:uncharacterized protein YcnI